MRSKTEAANGFKFSRTAFFLVVSLEHPRVDAGIFFQPLSNRFHRHSPHILLSTPRAAAFAASASLLQSAPPTGKLQVEKRGWTVDVLQVVQSLGKPEFTLADVYAHADALAKLHPNNAHIRDKIRQQPTIR